MKQVFEKLWKDYTNVSYFFLTFGIWRRKERRGREKGERVWIFDLNHNKAFDEQNSI